MRLIDWLSKKFQNRTIFVKLVDNGQYCWKYYILIDVDICCTILSNIVQYCQRFWNVYNTFKYCQVFFNFVKYTLLLSNVVILSMRIHEYFFNYSYFKSFLHVLKFLVGVLYENVSPRRTWLHIDLTQQYIIFSDVITTWSHNSPSGAFSIIIQ